VSVLQRPHGHHRDVPARLLAAHPARGIPSRDQDRHIMIKSARGRIAGPCFAGSRLALTRLARAPHRIAILSFDLRRPTPVVSIAIDRPGSSSPRSFPRQAFNAPRQRTASVEIPIASDVLLRHTSRGFLPRRFAYAGPPVCAAPPPWGRIREPLHSRRLHDARPISASRVSSEVLVSC